MGLVQFRSLITLQPSSILFITALSLGLNLHALAADSFWGDEILTALFAGTSPAEVIRWTASDIHPPLYYLVVGAFTQLTLPPGLSALPDQTSDWLWRFPSAVAGVLTVAVTYRLARHISRLSLPATPNQQKTSQSIAISAALLLCLAPVAIKYGQEVRMHGLFMLLAALSTWLFLRAMKHPQGWSYWLVYALTTTASIYTMYFGFLILATHAGHLLFSTMTSDQPRPPKTSSSLAPRQARITGFSAATFLAFLLYTPWWPILFNILRTRAAVGAIEGGVGPPLEFVFGVVQALGPAPTAIAWTFLLLFTAGLVFLARHNWPMAAFGGLWLALPIALPIVLGDPRALQFRYAFVLPIYLTIIAYVAVTVGLVEGWSWFSSRPASVRFNAQPGRVTYFIWLLATLSFVATTGVYNQTKPNWREAAAYLNERVTPADLILIGPLWDEGRFIDYYYRGQAQLLTPAAMVTNMEQRAAGLRSGGGQVWAVNRFVPAESHSLRNISFSGVIISEPQLTVYEAPLLTEAAISMARQAVEAAHPWAVEAEAQGVLDPDPRTARAAALRALGDTLVAAGRPEEAIESYQIAVDIFPGWVNGFVVLAETHEMVGNLPAAAEAYRQAVAFNPKWQGAQAKEAAALIEGGEWVNGLEKYHQIVGD